MARDEPLLPLPLSLAVIGLAAAAVTTAGCGASRVGPLLDETYAAPLHVTDSAPLSVRQARPGGPRAPASRVFTPDFNPFRDYRLGATNSSNPTPGPGRTFLAGFGKEDITPAPGLATFGWGPESRKVMGHRGRLYARAMVLEDERGELVAFVVADLGAISLILHRAVADSVHRRSGGRLGADRIILTATHTHSGPGSFLDTWPLNLFGSAVEGFDREFTYWLANRIASAVVRAFEDRVPARAAWNVVNLWGHTRNRSYDAFLENTRREPFPIGAPPAIAESLQAVNPQWAMLRVVRRDRDELMGTFNVFAVHGTAVSSGNDLYDGDLQGLVATRLERGLGGIHLLASGTQGDVSPLWNEKTRCRPPAFDRIPRGHGPRSPPALIDFDAPQTADECVEEALRNLQVLADRLSTDVRTVYASIPDDSLDTDITVRRSFQTVNLLDKQEGLCPRPLAGTALAAGAPDGETRFKGWKVLGLWPMGIEWGEAARSSDRLLCHYPKRTLLRFGQADIVGPGHFPGFAQFAVVRVGPVWLGAVPAEVTTVAGRQMLAALREGAASALRVLPDSLRPDRFVMIGLANGYLSYVTSWDEYQIQRYEGGSTLYGPGTARYMAGRMRELAANTNTPPRHPLIPTPVVRPGPRRRLISFARPADSTRFPVEPATVSCSARVVEAEWIDFEPGALQPADGLMVGFAAGDAVEVFDDDHRVEVRVGRKRGPGRVWRATWRPPAPIPSGTTVRVTFTRWGTSQDCQVAGETPGDEGGSSQ